MTNVCPNTVLPSVKVLALKVRFRVPKKVRTLLCFLRCFPGVETLHIMAVNMCVPNSEEAVVRGVMPSALSMNAQVKASSRSFSNLQVKTRIVRPKIQCYLFLLGL